MQYHHSPASSRGKISSVQRQKNAFPNELPARALIARARRELHGVSWGRSRAALDFHIYLMAPGSGIARLGAGGPPVARCVSIGGGCIRFAGDRCRLRCFDLRSAEMQMTARGEELCARHREREHTSSIMYEFIVVEPAGITLRLPLWDACIPAQSESVRAAVLDKKNTQSLCECERERDARDGEREMELAQRSEFACIFQDIVFDRVPPFFYYSARATYVARRRRSKI